MSTKVGMVMAMDENKLIGKDNGMPWRIPGEQAYFKKITLGKPIIMGRKTYDSIGRPLPGRPNIVVTRNESWEADGVHAVNSLDAAIDLANDLAKEAGVDEVMVIGGAGLCELAMPFTDRLYLTVIHHAYEGDTWLTSFIANEWQEVSRDDVAADGDVPAFSYRVLEREAVVG